MESLEEQQEREERHNAILREKATKEGKTQEEIEQIIKNVHTARGIRNANLIIQAGLRKNKNAFEARKEEFNKSMGIGGTRKKRRHRHRPTRYKKRK
jgi:hypothetical protein